MFFVFFYSMFDVLCSTLCVLYYILAIQSSILHVSCLVLYSLCYKFTRCFNTLYSIFDVRCNVRKKKKKKKKERNVEKKIEVKEKRNAEKKNRKKESKEKRKKEDEKNSKEKKEKCRKNKENRRRIHLDLKW